ncbi:histidine kinase [Mycobacterium sp. JS623]|uniref:sensor histidine kinase n=1 Tax=Mycobacterium sp. JS623 TaxID=212767 RepID=UPI0002A56EC7|nr:ATP-binding protein [Mycobacterium sp. JS623]AGB20525.1 histidine kinase [Mycobacterium sp. JS623]
MPGREGDTNDSVAQQFPQESRRFLYLSSVLQSALRAVLTLFAAATLIVEPPRAQLGTCAAVLAAYAVVVACWGFWALRPAARTVAVSRTIVTLLVLACDVAAVSVLSVLTGLTSPDEWTSDVMRIGFFLIPLIAAAQLDPVISGLVAMPTTAAFVATCWITKTANHEPWASIVLSTLVLVGLAGGSVLLSLIQRWKVDTIADLARQRRQLLQDLLGVEKYERQSISERLHDGALQCVLVARQDMEDVRDGSMAAADRVDVALVECSQLLRDAVRELHPDVLARMGLRAALSALTDSLTSRTGLVVELDARSWPDGVRTDADYVLYSAARETLTNVVKHARAEHVWIDLERDDGLGSLRVADDGVGISRAVMAEKARAGHIGLESIRAKALAAGGRCDVRPTSPGTEITIAIPLGKRMSDSESEAGGLAVGSP